MTVAVSVLASPVVWVHYFALAIVCIGLCSPTLSLVWFAPLALWLIPGQQAWASPWRIALALAVLASPLVLRGDREPASATSEPLADLHGIVST